MSAGTGIMHSEFNPSATEPVHLYQIWLLPEKRGLTPSYEQKRLTAEEKRGKLALVAAPEGGLLKIHQDARVLIGQVESGKQLNHELAQGRAAWVHLIRGDATVNGQPLTTGDAAAVTGENSIAIEGKGPDSEVLVFDLA